MLPIDPWDGQGSFLPRDQFSRIGGTCPPFPSAPHEDAPDRPSHTHHHFEPAATPARSLRHIVPAQAMAHGGTIIRPGAVAWGGLRDSADSRYSSGESIERILAAAVADPGQLPALLAELASTKLWVPLPVRRRPFTDGTAVRLPLVGYAETDTDFVPSFTSVQRLTTWSDAVEADPGGSGGGSGAASDEPGAGGGAEQDEFRFGGGGRQWQRAGDARVVPHVVVPAGGLARRLPAGLGLALNPDSMPGLPLFPEAVSYLARLDASTPALPTQTQLPTQTAAASHAAAATQAAAAIGQPPTEPLALLAEVRARLRALPPVRAASRGWLSVPGRGEGLVIAVALDDPASDGQRRAAIDALLTAVAAVPLRVPFPVDATFPGEPSDDAVGGARDSDLIADWIARNTHPFYTRD